MSLRWVVTLLLVIACQRQAPPVESLRLIGFQQAAAKGVLLNEKLVFYFSEDLDPSSVTPSSARVLDQNRRLVDGNFRVEGNRLVFEPVLARQAHLRDGGLLPGALYRVELTGFPVISGVRSREGRVLEKGYSSLFRTVEADSTGSLFLDGSPSSAASLYLSQTTFGVSEPIVLQCDEALDPRTIQSAVFDLRFESATNELKPVTLEARLISNSMDTGAVVELRAIEPGGNRLPRPLEPGAYHLWVHSGIADLGGLAVTSSWSVTQVPARLAIELLPEVAGNRSSRIDFLNRQMGSPEEVPGSDGAAVWDGGGALRVGWMAAAGSGADGLVTVDSREQLSVDVHASRFEIPSGAIVDLGLSAGGVVLRSQTSLRVNGALRRASFDPEWTRLEGEPWNLWYNRHRAVAQLAELKNALPQTLKEWLEVNRAREWTALVAGGDLVIDGSVQVDGPLLLAAGGRVRIGGTVEASEVWIVGLGGGSDVHPPARPAGLLTAPPKDNLLQIPLRLAHMSAPIRPTGTALRWRSAIVGAHYGTGSVRLRYFGERETASGTWERIGPVEDAALLDRCESIRLLIEMEIEPGGRWDPPMVDFVELRWTQDADL